MDIETFTDKLIAEKGLASEDVEVQAQIRNDLMDRIENRINAAIMREIPEEKLEGFDKIIDNGSESEIQAYLRESIPEFDQKIALELASFRAFYLG